MEVDGLMEVEELLCSSSPLDSFPSSLNSPSSEFAGEVLGCGLLGRGETDPNSEIEGAVEVVGRRIRGETGEGMVETGEKEDDSWIVFKGSIGASLPCSEPRPLLGVLTLKGTNNVYLNLKVLIV